MRKQFRQNGYYVRQDNNTVVGSQAKEQCCPKLARLNKELANLQDQAANIISLLSKLEESSPPPDKVSSINVKTPEKEESLEPEQVETPTVDETLTEHVAISKVEESMNHNHDSLIEEEEVYHVSLSEDQHHSEFQQLNQVGIWKEDEGTKERATHLKRVMKSRRIIIN